MNALLETRWNLSKPTEFAADGAQACSGAYTHAPRLAMRLLHRASLPFRNGQCGKGLPRRPQSTLRIRVRNVRAAGVASFYKTLLKLTIP